MLLKLELLIFPALLCLLPSRGTARRAPTEMFNPVFPTLNVFSLLPAETVFPVPFAEPFPCSLRRTFPRHVVRGYRFCYFPHFSCASAPFSYDSETLKLFSLVLFVPVPLCGFVGARRAVPLR